LSVGTDGEDVPVDAGAELAATSTANVASAPSIPVRALVEIEHI
jgi:hypothetical protein